MFVVRHGDRSTVLKMSQREPSLLTHLEEVPFLQNIKLTMGYDGTRYHGFQLQKNAHTIQAELEKAISIVFQSDIRITAAGRTDTGVHARGQVVNFYTDTTIPTDRIPYALNAVLSDDIVAYQAEVVPEAFHARYDAKGKIYTYTIDNAPHPRVMTRYYAYHVRFPVDAMLMRAAAATLVGKKDFASYMNSGSSVKTTVRNLSRLDVQERDRFITITAEADGFLYNMVRIITGTLIEVGRGKRDPNLTPLFAEKNRDVVGWTVPPHGLVLEEVQYF
jgi:tRNA pseudouridine38-40 synthase